MERFFENAMYASRWLLAPIYMGLSLALLALTIKFFQEIFHVIPNIFAMAEADLILVLLSLIDMALVGGLLVMVMISGYENFVSQLDIDEGKEKLSWLGKMDSGSLKNKVAASIVAISSIHLLRIFMDAKNVPDNKLMWYVIIHMTFVLSAFAMDDHPAAFAGVLAEERAVAGHQGRPLEAAQALAPPASRLLQVLALQPGDVVAVARRRRQVRRAAFAESTVDLEEVVHQQATAPDRKSVV